MNAQKSIAPAFLAALLLSVSGCGGGGGGGTDAASGSASGGGSELPPDLPAIEGDDYLAMQAGNRWLYKVTSPEAPPESPYTYGMTRYVSADPIEGQPTLHRYSTGYTGAVAPSSRVMQTEAGVFDIVDSAWWGDLAERQYLQVLSLPLTPAGSYTLIDLQNVETLQDIDTDGIPENYSILRQGEIIGTETVTVPAGTFDNAIRVRTVKQFSFTYSSGTPSEDVTSTIDDWYAFGYGIVKSVVHTTSSFTDRTDTHELVGFRIGGVSTDSTLPTVLNTVPWNNAVESDIGTILIAFSEYVDPFFAKSSISITDQDGYRPGFSTDTTNNGKTIVVDFYSSLHPGTYTVSVTGITDGLGNTMSGTHRFSFIVD